MAGNLKMNTSELTLAKNKITIDNEELGQCIQNIYKEVNKLTSGTWKGDAATEANSQITEFYKKTFQAYKKAVDGYVKFIEATVKRYDANEDALKSNAKSSMDNSQLANFK